MPLTQERRNKDKSVQIPACAKAEKLFSYCVAANKSCFLSVVPLSSSCNFTNLSRGIHT